MAALWVASSVVTISMLPKLSAPKVEDQLSAREPLVAEKHSPSMEGSGSPITQSKQYTPLAVFSNYPPESVTTKQYQEPKLAEAQRSPLKTPLPLIVLTVLVLMAGLLFWRLFLRVPVVPSNIITMTGRIEGDEASVAAKAAGRIGEVTVREGDQVQAGQIIATIEDDQLKSREESAQAAVQQSEARLVRSQQQIAVLQAQLAQSEMGVNQAGLDAEGRVHQAEAQLAGAEAQLAQAQVVYSQARYDAQQLTKLENQGVIPESSGRQARSVEEGQAATVQAARKQVEAARGGLTVAHANQINPQIRSSQSGAIQQQILQAQADVSGAQSDIQGARAQYREAQANRRDLQVIAPFAGTVATRTAEPGEVVAVGTPIITLVNLDEVYLRAFVTEGQIGRVKVGQPARVYLDSDPRHSLDAVVTRINPEASFTPANTYFRDDRVKQVVGVRLQLTNAQRSAKPGMPADGEILVTGNIWPLDTGHR
jgi:HlyD family secretion protein